MRKHLLSIALLMLAGLCSCSNEKENLISNYDKHKDAIYGLAGRVSRIPQIIAIDLKSRKTIAITYTKDTSNLNYDLQTETIEIRRLFRSNENFVRGVENKQLKEIVEGMKSVHVMKISVEDEGIRGLKRGQVEMEFSRDIFESLYYKIFIVSMDSAQRAFFNEHLVNKLNKGRILDDHAIWYER